MLETVAASNYDNPELSSFIPVNPYKSIIYLFQLKSLFFIVNRI